jgi:hypothetical protein
MTDESQSQNANQGLISYAVQRTDRTGNLDKDRRLMNEIYALRRANGDWFSLDNGGGYRVPIFRNRSDAMIARARNFEMLLFNPVELTLLLIKQLVPASGSGEVDFCMIRDPLDKLDRGRLLKHADLEALVLPD